MNKSLIFDIYNNGYSRIPVYEKKKNNIKYIFYTKDLLVILNSNKEITIKEFMKSINCNTKCDCLYLDKNISIKKAVDEIQKNLKHMVIVTDGKDKECIGLLTLEDLLEYILDKNIGDEYDSSDNEDEGNIN